MSTKQARIFWGTCLVLLAASIAWKVEAIASWRMSHNNSFTMRGRVIFTRFPWAIHLRSDSDGVDLHSFGSLWMTLHSDDIYASIDPTSGVAPSDTDWISHREWAFRNRDGQNVHSATYEGGSVTCVEGDHMFGLAHVASCRSKSGASLFYQGANGRVGEAVSIMP